MCGRIRLAIESELGVAVMHDAVEDDDVSILKRLCICMIEFLSDQAIDPHLYFQQKMTGEVEQAGSTDDLIEFMRRLISWVDTMEFRPAQSERLDAILSDQGFPSLSIMRITENENIVKRLTENP
jgi:hypothetical protein